MKLKKLLGIFFFLTLITTTVFGSIAENPRQGFDGIFTGLHQGVTLSKAATAPGLSACFLESSRQVFLLGQGGDLPPDAQNALSEIEKDATRPNVRNPKPFVNDGRGGTPQLPSVNTSGNPITYIENTVNPRPPGGTLDGKRIITGNDGSVWYTDDHFTTWTKVK